MSILEILGAKDLSSAKKLITNQLFQDKPPLAGHLEMVIAICEKHNLNPLLGELYIRHDGSGAIYPTLTADGWYNLVNSHPECDGYEFVESDEMIQLPDNPYNQNGNMPLAYSKIGCRIFRKGRQHAPIIYEYVAEVFNPNNPAWFTHPNRLLRHKSFSQAARIVFSLSGIYEPEEVDRIISSKNVEESKADEKVISLPTPEPSVMVSDEPDFEVIEPDAMESVVTDNKSETIKANDHIDVVQEQTNKTGSPTAVNEVEINDPIKPPNELVIQVEQYLQKAKASNNVNACVKHLIGRIDKIYHPYIKAKAEAISS